MKLVIFTSKNVCFHDFISGLKVMCLRIFSACWYLNTRRLSTYTLNSVLIKSYAIFFFLVLVSNIDLPLTEEGQIREMFSR